MGRRGRSDALDGDLRLIHITPVGALREIIRGGRIETRPCRVFRGERTYFFLERPAFRVRNAYEPTPYISAFPSAMVFRTEALPPPIHVYPIDTGGLMGGAFGGYPDEHVYLEDYALDPQLDAARGHIHWAFGDRASYYDGDLRPGLIGDLPNFDEVGIAFLNLAMLASREQGKPDARASAVEVAFDKPIPTKGQLEFVVLPKQYLEAPGATNNSFMEALEAQGADWLVYDWQPNKAPEDFTAEVIRLIRRRRYGDA